MKIEQYTYWSVTINNPDDNDYLIMRNPNEKYIRTLVWTEEEGGEEHTPPLHAWVRLQRNNSQSFMKRLYPRAHLRAIDKDQYNEACHAYAQKNDETTAGNHIISINDPLPANDTLLYKVIEEGFALLMKVDEDKYDHYLHEGPRVVDRLTLKKLDTVAIERDMVSKRAGLEKIFCSPAYDKMKQKFWREILFRILNKTDEDAIKCSSATQETEVETSDRDSDSDEESGSETDEGSSESSGSEVDEEDDE